MNSNMEEELNQAKGALRFSKRWLSHIDVEIAALKENMLSNKPDKKPMWLGGSLEALHKLREELERSNQKTQERILKIEENGSDLLNCNREDFKEIGWDYGECSYCGAKDTFIVDRVTELGEVMPSKCARGCAGNPTTNFEVDSMVRMAVALEDIKDSQEEIACHLRKGFSMLSGKL